MKMNKTDSQEVPKEMETDAREFERIYKLFHEDPGESFNKKIMTELEQVLMDNDIGDYRIADVTFVSRNPPGWHPYVRRCNNGICFGWTYT